MKKYVIVSIVIAIVAFGFWDAQRPNEEVISIPDEIYLVVEDEVFTDNSPVILEEGVIYMSLDIIKEYIDHDIFYDTEEETVIFTNEEKVSRFIIGNDKATVNHREFYIDNPIKQIDERVYIPEEILYSYYDVEINYWEETNAITMDKLDSNYVQGQVILEGGDLRFNSDKKSPIVLKDLPVETELLVFEEYKDWYKVRTFDGIIGYIQKEYLKINLSNDIYKVEVDSRDEDFKNKEKINLTWDYTHGIMKTVGDIQPIYGINVVSPTWFSITNEEGDIFDKGNKEYVNEYRILGYEIWPLIDNSFDPDLTHELLANSQSREKLIKKMVQLYDEYNVDGINLDFENVYLDDRDLLTQFVRELYPVFKEKGMTVSMDVTPISTSENWSLSFDRESLSETVDYIMLMAYDQHWAASPVAGSVAQYSWVEESIKGVLKEVPNEKLVLSVPFYTRLWTIEETDDGENVSSQALSMEAANNFIEENNMELEWEEESGQYFGEITKEKKTYKIWVEDSESLQLKSSLINKYDLAGIASWRKGFEIEEVWPAISNSIMR